MTTVNASDTELLEKIQAKLAELPPPHPSVAHVKLNVEGFLEAAECRVQDGSLLSAFHCASVAEGIAMALEAVAGIAEGLRERLLCVRAARRRVELELELTAKIREWRANANTGTAPERSEGAGETGEEAQNP